MLKIFKIVFFLIIFLSPSQSYSFVSGYVSCGKFLNYVETVNAGGIMGQINFVNGLISGINIELVRQKKTTMKFPDFDTIKFTLVKGCEGNPMSDTFDVFFDEIYVYLESN